MTTTAISSRSSGKRSRRQYDAENSDSTAFGNLRPRKRARHTLNQLEAVNTDNTVDKINIASIKIDTKSSIKSNKKNRKRSFNEIDIDAGNHNKNNKNPNNNKHDEQSNPNKKIKLNPIRIIEQKSPSRDNNNMEIDNDSDNDTNENNKEIKEQILIDDDGDVSMNAIHKKITKAYRAIRIPGLDIKNKTRYPKNRKRRSGLEFCVLCGIGA